MKLIFQMACMLHSECNFLHKYFRCQLPVEMVDVEVKTMQGFHTFRRDGTSQVIKCNPWSTKLCPYPSPHLEDENILGTGRETWSQDQAPTPNPAAMNPYVTKPTKTSPTKHQPQSQEIPRTQNKCH